MIRLTLHSWLVLTLTKGGGFAIPAVEFVYGDDWRLKIEADLWFNDGDTKKTCKGSLMAIQRNGSNSCGALNASGYIGGQGGNGTATPVAGGDFALGKRENSAGFHGLLWLAITKLVVQTN